MEAIEDFEFISINGEPEDEKQLAVQIVMNNSIGPELVIDPLSAKEEIYMSDSVKEELPTDFLSVKGEEFELASIKGEPEDEKQHLLQVLGSEYARDRSCVKEEVLMSDPVVAEIKTDPLFTREEITVNHPAREENLADPLHIEDGVTDTTGISSLSFGE